jgi:hypothetical protein
LSRNISRRVESRDLVSIGRTGIQLAVGKTGAASLSTSFKS